MLSEEWLEIFQKKETKRKFSQKSSQVLVYYNKSKAAGDAESETDIEYACIWSSQYTPSTRITTVELKFLSSAYVDNLQDIIQHYFDKYVNLNDEGGSVSEYYDLIVPDFYNVGNIFSSIAKKSKLKSVESWTEFILFPSINFNVNIFSNKKLSVTINQSKSKQN